MKKVYEKPEVEVIDFEIGEPIMDAVITPSWGFDEDDDIV